MPTFAQTKYELVIIGAGPTGLGAAVYATREGMSTLVLDKSVVGGLAAITDRIDNYPGFDQGVSGLDLSEHLENHARRFGAEIHTGVEVQGLTRSESIIHVQTSAGAVQAEAVLIATGSTYKHLSVPGEQEYIGRGVHFCATCDAPLYRGRDVAVVGGGNSAIQESLFIAKFAKHVTLLVRGPQLSGTEILREQLQALPNVSFHYNTVVDSLRGDTTRITGLHARDTATGNEHDIRTDAVFVFIGLLANTQPFATTIELDPGGFVITQDDFATSLPGVYAAGDVRSGSTWQIASAVGEGVSATLAIRAYLDQLHHAAHTAKTMARRHAKTPAASRADA
ncbi:MAG TPA: FAD-dependent oxidoreductase [Candidatus Saccharimonadia bacterium]